MGKSDDTIESKLNEFLSSRKKAYSKTSKGAWFDSDLDIVKSYGLSNIFETRDSETNANDKVNEICKWVCDNNKMPSRMSKDENEVILSKTLVKFRQTKKAKKHQWFESNDKIALQYGLPNLFEVTKNINKTETE